MFRIFAVAVYCWRNAHSILHINQDQLKINLAKSTLD